MNDVKRAGISGLVLLLLIGLHPAQVGDPALAWPAITQQTKPWTRWWWHGSSVNEADLTASMEAYQRAGLGGLEITPIYGVAGHEDAFIPYLSPAWMEMLAHTLREGQRLGLGLDMATGTGWPFGGPWVTAEDASKAVVHKTYVLEEGERLHEPIRYRQEPFVRAVGNQIYELHGIYRRADEQTQGSIDEPLLRAGADEIDGSQLVEPISANENLQALALEQVNFEKSLPPQVVMAYSDGGTVVDLTDKVNANGRLGWVAPAGTWTLYAVFQGWHGKMVERAAPGGEGHVIDHFSQSAIEHYLQRFDQAFDGHDLSTLRAFFNDSYEVDDARGQADWTPRLFEAFEARRGYDLRTHLPALFGDAPDDEHIRVLTDYRETISDLLLETFTTQWRSWAHRNGAVVRNQAHGSPANILDLYAASDIPETEGNDVLRAKLASSAAHVTGKRLVSSESATWLNEHFTSNLADVKQALDLFFLSGVNHVFYHGTAYSPEDETWPGWLFYASVHLTRTNPLWHHFAALNRYVARVQSFLQDGQPANDVLLYLPIYDRYADPGDAMLRHFGGGQSAFEGTAAEAMQARGYAFDFISDRQLQQVAAEEGQLQTGGGAYQTIVLPQSRFIPLPTFEKVIALAEAGATIVAYRSLPADVPGRRDLDARRAAFQRLVERLRFADTEQAGVREATLGEGRFVLADDLEHGLSQAEVRREALVDDGLQFVRRRYGAGTRYSYFIANRTDTPFDGWMPLAVDAPSMAIFNPRTGQSGFARVRPSASGGMDVYLQLPPGEATLLKTVDTETQGRPYTYYAPAGAPQVIDGTWTIAFVRGGPALPPDQTTTELGSWTELDGDAVTAFSGTGRYTTTFPQPDEDADGYLLDLGAVHESAVVRLNGQVLDTLIGPTYQTLLDAGVLHETNTLEISVSNLMANRIADLDRRQVPWKKFYNINVPARFPENRNERGLFDASAWEPRPSGLVGPVTLTPVDTF